MSLSAPCKWSASIESLRVCAHCSLALLVESVVVLGSCRHFPRNVHSTKKNFTYLDVVHAMAHVVDSDGLSVSILHNDSSSVPRDTAESNHDEAEERHGQPQDPHCGLLATGTSCHRLPHTHTQRDESSDGQACKRTHTHTLLDCLLQPCCLPRLGSEIQTSRACRLHRYLLEMLHRYLLELGVHMTLECCAGGDGASGLNNVWCIASKELERFLSGAAFIT